LNTPIYDFLLKYAESNMLRCHMPGHKGNPPENELGFMFDLDITEISGADSLFEAEGIIAESEHNMTKLYGSSATVYSAGGSTLCIQTMLALMKQEKRKIFAVRNVHRSFLNASALLDLDVDWIFPHYFGGILSGKVVLEEIERKLAECREPCCVYITSPDYTGRIADIKGISEICHRHKAKLLVDNAHGAHLAFFKNSCHPISLGADLCCDSAHKMLPALTGAAMLHTVSDQYAERIKQTMSLFASTSPSYLIMASLDLCCKYIFENIRSDIESGTVFIMQLKNKFSGKLIFADGEPFHITVKASASGYNGLELEEKLRKFGAECEYADRDIVICLMSPVNCRKDYEKLSEALEYAAESSEKHELTVEDDIVFPQPEKVMSIRDAVFAEQEEISVENSLGRICAAVRVPCPPAVPIAVSGEKITCEHINIFKRYGISTVNVVK